MKTYSTALGSAQGQRSPFPVTVRPLQPDDAGAVYDLHRRLLPESLYHRFQQYRIPTLAEIAALCEMSPQQGEGLVAVTPTPRKQVVGMAYYVRGRDEHGPSAELAIVVDDRCQGLGVGRLLWQRLHQQAQARGLTTLRVLFDARNHRMQRLIQGSGYHFEQCYQTVDVDDLNDYRIMLENHQDPSRVRRFWAKVAPRLF